MGIQLQKSILFFKLYKGCTLCGIPWYTEYNPWYRYTGAVHKAVQCTISIMYRYRRTYDNNRYGTCCIGTSCTVCKSLYQYYTWIVQTKIGTTAKSSVQHLQVYSETKKKDIQQLNKLHVQYQQLYKRNVCTAFKK